MTLLPPTAEGGGGRARFQALVRRVVVMQDGAARATAGGRVVEESADDVVPDALAPLPSRTRPKNLTAARATMLPGTAPVAARRAGGRARAVTADASIA